MQMIRVSVATVTVLVALLAVSANAQAVHQTTQSESSWPVAGKQQHDTHDRLPFRKALRGREPVHWIWYLICTSQRPPLGAAAV